MTGKRVRLPSGKQCITSSSPPVAGPGASCSTFGCMQSVGARSSRGIRRKQGFSALQDLRLKKPGFISVLTYDPGGNKSPAIRPCNRQRREVCRTCHQVGAGRAVSFFRGKRTQVGGKKARSVNAFERPLAQAGHKRNTPCDRSGARYENRIARNFGAGGR